MKYLFLDTNILLHYQWFEEIPWQEVLGISEDVTIVICETVIAEIDKHKDGQKGKVRDKAKKISAHFAKIFLDNINGKIPVVNQLNCMPNEDQRMKYDTSVNDNRILLSALNSSFSRQDIIVVSADNNLLIKAKTEELNIFQMKDEFKLPLELSEDEKKIKELQKQLERYEKRLSKPIVKFEKTSESVLILKRPNPVNIDNEVDRLVAQEALKYPEKGEPKISYNNYLDIEFQNACKQLTNLSSIMTPDQISNYNKMRKKYLDVYRKKQSLIIRKSVIDSNFIPLQFQVSNIGSKMTGELLIQINFPYDIKLYSDLSKITYTYNKPIEPRFENINQIIAINQIMNPHIKTTDEISMFDENKPLKDNCLTYRYNHIIHGTSHTFDNFVYVDLRQFSEFDITWTIADSELIDHESGTLKVKVQG